MALDVLDVSDLAEFTGRPEVTFIPTPRVDTALAQARLLFVLATGLTDWPTDPDMLLLARFGMLSMSDALFLALKYQQALVKPFSSETIGSYSYSRASGAVANQLPTGVSWFDMAVDYLAVVEGSAVIFNSSISVFEHDGITSRDGQLQRLGPRDFVYTGWPFNDPAPRAYSPTNPWWVSVS